MQDFRRLSVWQKAHDLTLRVYRETMGFPHAEQFGLTSQLRRAAASIPTNVAEGCCRQGDKSFAYFVNIAAGSCNEVEYLLLLTKDLKYLDDAMRKSLSDDVIEVRRMLLALLTKLRT